MLTTGVQKIKHINIGNFAIGLIEGLGVAIHTVAMNTDAEAANKEITGKQIVRTRGRGGLESRLTSREWVNIGAVTHWRSASVKVHHFFF